MRYGDSKFPFQDSENVCLKNTNWDGITLLTCKAG